MEILHEGDARRVIDTIRSAGSGTAYRSDGLASCRRWMAGYQVGVLGISDSLLGALKEVLAEFEG